MSIKITEFKDSVTTAHEKAGAYPYYTKVAVTECNKFIEENDIEVIDITLNTASNQQHPNFSISTILLTYKEKADV